MPTSSKELQEKRKAMEKELEQEIKEAKRREFLERQQAQKDEIENHRKKMAENWNLDPNDPQFQRAYNYAYQEGHSEGFVEVENCFDDVMYIITGEGKP